MSIAASAEEYLRMQSVVYQVLSCPACDSLYEAAQTAPLIAGTVLRATIVECNNRPLMVISPCDRILDIEALRVRLGFKVGAVPQTMMQHHFHDCHPRFIPALPGAYGVDAIMDESVVDLNRYWLASGDKATLLAMERPTSETIWPSISRGAFTRRCATLIRADFDDDAKTVGTHITSPTPLQLRHRIQALNHLPPMPAMAQQLLKLRANPLACVDDLVAIVELDPSLAAQLVAYASSAYYGYLGNVHSIRDAITRVLGFDMVMNMALGLAIGKTLSIPAHGPVGLRAYWRNAVHSAALAECLAKKMPRRHVVWPGMAYLAGLLHDFGYLLLGHVFKTGFDQLNELAVFNADLPLVDLETHVLGVRHDQLGAWLMRSWEMPNELTVATRWHHTEDFQGDHIGYQRLMKLTDRLLALHALNDVDNGVIHPVLLHSLGLSREQALAALQTVVDARSGLDQLAKQLAA